MQERGPAVKKEQPRFIEKEGENPKEAPLSQEEKDKTPIELSAEDEKLLSIVGAEQKVSKWHIYNLPPDKHIEWPTDKDLQVGRYVGWVNYTVPLFKEDQEKYQTRFASPHHTNGDQIRIGLHRPVFVPMNVWQERERRKRLKERMVRGQFPAGASGSERIVKGNQEVFRKTHNAQPL